MTTANNVHKPTDKSVARYLADIAHAGRREDAVELIDIMREASNEEPVVWGGSIVGFGTYHYVYASGREGDSCLTGFAARKANMVVYIMPGFADHQGLLGKLGKHKTGSSCLYLGRLSGIDKRVLRRLVAASVKYMRKKYPGPTQ